MRQEKKASPKSIQRIQWITQSKQNKKKPIVSDQKANNENTHRQLEFRINRQNMKRNEN